MKHIIEVNGIELYAHHGCMDEEGRIGGHYVVNVYMEVNFLEAALTDNLYKTVDYCDVNKIVEEEMAIRSLLIEHVGKRIVDRIKQLDHDFIKLRVKIIKKSPPINGNVDHVAIVIEE